MIDFQYKQFQFQLNIINFSEATEAKFDELNNVSDVQCATNEFDTYPSTLDAARTRNRKIIEVSCKISQFHPRTHTNTRPDE